MLLIASATLAALIGSRQVALRQPASLNPRRLPGTLDNYSLRFDIR